MDRTLISGTLTKMGFSSRKRSGKLRQQNNGQKIHARGAVYDDLLPRGGVRAPFRIQKSNDKRSRDRNGNQRWLVVDAKRQPRSTRQRQRKRPCPCAGSFAFAELFAR